jgi:hypothetical protein
MNILLSKPARLSNDEVDRIGCLKASLELALIVLTSAPRTRLGLDQAISTAVTILGEAARADDTSSFSLH